MKRFHVHIRVDNLPQSIQFYSALFAAQPSVLKPDYAKWMLDDPRINFAISQRGAKSGLDHFGFQVDSDDELTSMQQQLSAAEIPLETHLSATCCYAKSDKYWSVDPQGIAWETFHTLADIPLFTQEASLSESKSRGAQSKGSCGASLSRSQATSCC